MKPNRFADWVSAFLVVYILAILLGLSQARAEGDYRNYTDGQHELMQHAYEVGLPHDLGWTMMGILIRESQINTIGPVGDHHRPPGKRSYGAMQVTVAAAKDVLFHHCPDLNPGVETEEEIISYLIVRPKWNIEVAGCYLAHMRSQTVRLSNAIAAYNMGLGNLRKYGRGVIESTEAYIDFVLHAVNYGEVRHYYYTHIRG